MIIWSTRSGTGSPASSVRPVEDERNCDWKNGRLRGMHKAREPSVTISARVGDHPCPHKAEGLDQAGAQDDEAGGMGAWFTNGGTGRVGLCDLLGSSGELCPATDGSPGGFAPAGGYTDIPAIVKQLSNRRRWAEPLLANVARTTDVQSREHLHAALALLPGDASQVDYLLDRLLQAKTSELPVLRDALQSHRATLTPKLWTVLFSAKPGDASLLPCASALAKYAPDDLRWEAAVDKVARAMVSVNPVFLGSWLDALRPCAAGYHVHWPQFSRIRNVPRPNTRWRPISLRIMPATIPTGLPSF